MIAESYAISHCATDVSAAYGSIAEPSQNIAGLANTTPNSMTADDSGAPAINFSTAENAAAYSSEQRLVDSYGVNENLAVHANSALESAHVERYGSGWNGNATALQGNDASAAENGVSSSDHTGSATLHQPLDGSGLSAEEERLWSIVTANSLEFGAWTALIEETEKTSDGNISKLRKVYDAFLVEFPLCYGYWKKYADHEARLSSAECVAGVYERAVHGVTYSVDMWVHYCAFAIGAYGDPETIRRLFERALAYVGSDYLCFPIWDKYIEYEISLQAWNHVAAIYTRVLEVPNQQLDRYFEGFKELVASRPLSELQTPEEASATTAVITEVVNNETKEETSPVATEQSSKTVNEGLKDVEELENYINIREEIYKKAKDFDSKIAVFETGIRRPYFHVRPLNVSELENWHNYLDYIESGDDFNKIVKLYERCLIACANYPEYWIRYILCMEASGSMELAENALARATQVFVKRQPEIHLFSARFKEQHGKLEDACSLYEQAIAIEKGKEHSQTLPMLFAQYSRFVYLVSGNIDKAREILMQGVESAQLSKPLLEAMIHLESIHSQSKPMEYLDTLVDKFLSPSSDALPIASDEEKEELSSIFLEFLDLFGDAQLIKKADNRHAKLFLRHKSISLSKKRHAEDYLVSDRMKFAKSLTPASGSSAVGSYPGTQNQWAAGYGAQPQVWPQAQQWTPGYAQQAPYGAYGASYVQPQMQASVPPSAGAYGTYPPTYPTQAFPQQVYPQPTSAATLASAPQPTAATAASYYTGYY